ncbi:Putative odorant receptor 22c [Harpegnathos saltator]|uniref:Putative odorant receptor 22c n=1 Tax=Harpegnathos saltator TaxID=610380 RepID=E2B2Y4_HARSA|nr:Putative odorant receptor 22c [Harpegnathos saltator]
MESTWDSYYGVTKKFLLLTGQWPHQDRNDKVLRLSVITMAILVMLVPQIKALTDRVFIDWEGLRKNPEEYKIMKTYVANARWIVFMYSTVCLVSVTVFVMVSLVPYILDRVLPLNESRPIVLPYEAYYFVDERKYFFYIFSQGFVAAEIVVIGLVAYDTMFMTFVEHLCGIFSVTGFRFERLVREDTDVMEIVRNDLGVVYNKRIAYCVEMHCAAIEFAGHLEETFSLNFGIELLLVTIVMSITLFQVTSQSNIVEAMRYLIYVIAQLVHLFVFCWEGQRLIDHSLQIRDKM